MDLARQFGGKKFMWDGQVYDDEETGRKQEIDYQGEGFEVRSVSEDGKIFLFTRRVVTSVP